MGPREGEYLVSSDVAHAQRQQAKLTLKVTRPIACSTELEMWANAQRDGRPA